MSALTTYNDTLTLDPGCYTFEITDTDDDGIDFWANNDGVGFCRIWQISPLDILAAIEGDFGRATQFDFTVGYPLSTHDFTLDESIVLYPNPTQGQFTLEGRGLHQASITVLNGMGQVEQVERGFEQNRLVLDGTHLAAGIYFVVIAHEDQRMVKKLVVK